MAYEAAFLALSDPTRRAIFEAVATRPQAVSQLAQATPVSRPAVSQHLRVLSDAGLVEARPEGTRRIYALRAKGLADLRAYLDQFWDQALAGFAAEVEDLEGQDRDQPHRQEN